MGIIMLCVYCGRQIEDDSVFCRFCGKKVKKEANSAKKRRKKASAETASWMEGSHYRAAGLKTMPKKRGKAPIIIGLSVLAAAAGAAVYFLFF
jgi:uncharacterized membrane protein YvbJ